MLKHLLLTCLLSMSLGTLESLPSTVSEGLDHFIKMSPEEQKEALKEKQVILDAKVLEYLADKLVKDGDDSQRKAFIQQLMEKYTPEERQVLINQLLVAPDYYTRISSLPLNECASIEKNAYPTYFPALTIIDFINTINFPSFFDPVQKNALHNSDYFNAFNTFDQIGIFLEPYGYITSFNQSSPSFKFDLKTLGLSLEGAYSITERLVVNLGLGYSHSTIDWIEISDNAVLNTFYCLPSLSYLFSYGYISLEVLGAVNFYDINRETQLFPNMQAKSSQGKITSWDIAGRLKSGLIFPLKASFYLYPSAIFDYSVAFLQKSTEQLEKRSDQQQLKETDLIIDPLTEHFLHWGFELKLTFEYFKHELGFLIPYFSIGWMESNPLSQKKVHYTLSGCEKIFEQTAKTNLWNQYVFGLGLSFLHVRGIYATLDYQYNRGKECSTHLGTMHIGLTW